MQPAYLNKRESQHYLVYRQYHQQYQSELMEDYLKLLKVIRLYYMSKYYPTLTIYYVFG